MNGPSFLFFGVYKYIQIGMHTVKSTRLYLYSSVQQTSLIVVYSAAVESILTLGAVVAVII